MLTSSHSVPCVVICWQGYEFHLIDQLIAEKIPQLGVDFHSFDLVGIHCTELFCLSVQLFRVDNLNPGCR